MPIRILVTDDHQVVRKGLREYIMDDPELDIVGEAANGAEALRLARELRPDVVLMDLVMPEMSGVEATAAIRRALPGTEVVALTGSMDTMLVVEAVRAGAIGYVLKNAAADDLIQTIKAAAAGQVRLSPEAVSRLVHEVREPINPEKLTERETDVLRHLAGGLSNKEIAVKLSLSEATVKSHVSKILAKLGVASRTQAALHAVRIGLVIASSPHRTG